MFPIWKDFGPRAVEMPLPKKSRTRCYHTMAAKLGIFKVDFKDHQLIFLLCPSCLSSPTGLCEQAG